ncbi:phage tail protein [Paenisporosarcina sp. NPDC076898]|uniref:phage tail protein n=1 Tax=unclassified Paenisporosarcina TaxID=2642018 RepID=UPI003D049A9C
MPTTKLGLPTISGNLTNDVVTHMNALAEAVDNKAGANNGLATLGSDGKVHANQLNVQEIPDASLTVKGITKLNNAVNSTSETEAATPKAVKTANDNADSRVLKSSINQPNGVAGLDGTGKIPQSALPSAGVNSYFEKIIFNSVSIPANGSYVRKITLPGEMVDFKVNLYADYYQVTMSFQANKAAALANRVYAQRIAVGEDNTTTISYLTNSAGNVALISGGSQIHAGISLDSLIYNPTTNQIEITLKNLNANPVAFSETFELEAITK